MPLLVLNILIPAKAACIYPLNANSTQATQYSLIATNDPNKILIFPTINNQTATAKLEAGKQYITSTQAGLQSAINSYSITPNPPKIGDLSLGSGLLAGEVEFTTPNTNLAGNNLYRLGVTIFASRPQDSDPESARLEIGLIRSSLNGVNNFSLNIYVLNWISYANIIKTYPLNLTSTQNNLGLYINNSTGQLGLIINGDNKGYITDILPPNLTKLVMTPVSHNEMLWDDANIGKEISINLITDRSLLKNTYPTGTKDLCGFNS